VFRGELGGDALQQLGDPRGELVLAGRGVGDGAGGGVEGGLRRRIVHDALTEGDGAGGGADEGRDRGDDRGLDGVHAGGGSLAIHWGEFSNTPSSVRPS